MIELLTAAVNTITILDVAALVVALLQPRG